MALKKEITQQIRDLLKQNPGGLSITAIVRQIPINRNTAGRYLENLMVSGQVEMRHFGMAKIYSLAQRVPLSAMLSISSELIMLLDGSRRVLYANEPMLQFLDIPQQNLYGKTIEFTPVLSVFDDAFDLLKKKIHGGIAGKEWSGEIAALNGTIIFDCRVAPAVFEEGQRGVSILLENITERKKSERQIKESEQQFRLLAENTLDIISRSTQNGICLYISPAIKSISGFEPRDVVGKNASFFVHPDDLPRILRSMKKMTRARPTITITYRSLHKDGHYVWAESLFRGIFSEDSGELTEIYGVTRDVTDRILAEQELRESEDRYRSLVEISPDAIILHQEGRMVYMNPAALELLGIRSISELPSPSIIDIVHPDFRHIVEENIKNDLSGRQTPLVELRVMRFDGTSVMVEGRGGKTQINGKPAIQVTLRDITERKRAEDAIRESEGKYRTLVETTDTGYVIIDSKGCVLDANPEYVRLTGHSSLSEIRGRSVIEWTTEYNKGKNAQAVQQCIRDGFIQNFEVDYAGDAGTIIPIEINATVFRSEDGFRILTLCRDITERRKAQTALQESEGKYRDLVEQSLQGLTIIQNGRPVFTNPAMLEIGGYSYEEYLGLSAEEMMATIHPLDRDHIRDVMENRLKRRDIPQEHEFRLLRKDGSIRWVLTHSTLITYNGSPAIQIAYLDITDQKKTEDALWRSRQQLEDAMDMAQLVTWEYDSLSRQFLFNDRFFALFGTTAEREGGAAMPVKVFVREFVHPDDMDRVVSEAQKALKSTGPKYAARQEIRMVRRDGEVRNILALIRIMRDPGGKAISVQGTLQDITDQKRAEDALRKSRQQLEDAMGMASLYTWEYNMATDRFVFNDHLFTLFGTTIGQESTYSISGDAFLRKYVHPDDHKDIVTVFKNALKLPDPQYSARKEARIIRRDGKIRNVITLIRIQRDPDGRAISIHGTLQDITEQKRAEDAIRESEATARALINAPTDRIILTDKSGKILDLNDAAAQSLGRARDEILGADPSAVLSMASAAARMPRMGEVVETGKAVRFVDERNGVWFDNVIYPVFSPEGEVIRLAIVARDITDRKQAEAALLDSESRYRTLAEASRDIVFVIGPDDTVEYVNSYAATILGIPDGKVVGWKRSSFFASGTGEQQTQALQRVFKTGKPERIEGPMVVSENRHWFDHHLMPIADADGKVTAVLGVSRDITDRKQAEEALAESENRFHSLAELLPQNVWECDIDGKLTFANRHSFEMYRYTMEDLQKGLYVWQMIHPGDRERVMGDFIEALKHSPEDFPAYHEYTAVRSDGSTFPVLMYHAPIIINGLIAGMRGIGIDLTGRREMEEALRETVRTFRLLAENSVDMIYRILPDGTCAYVSPAIRSSLGYEPEEFVGHHGSEFLHPDDIPHVIEMMTAFENDGTETGADRFRLRNKDGSYIWFDTTIRATRDEKTGIIREFTLVSRYAGNSEES